MSPFNEPQGSFRRSPGSERGFTLVEVIVAIGIVGSATAIVGVALAPLRDRMVVRHELNRIETFLVSSREAALQNGLPQSVSFDSARRELVVSSVQTLRLSSEVALTLTSAKEAGHVASDGRPGIVFLPDGTSSGAEIWIRAARSGAFGSRLRISWATGALRRE